MEMTTDKPKWNKREKPENPFIAELKKYVGLPVKVFSYTPNGKEVTQEGTLRCIDYNQKAVILMTDTHKILIRSYYKIERKRTYEPPKEVPKKKDDKVVSK